MAQTISELEKERAELLKKIEAEANQISSSRGEPKEHTLQDWLKAAESVIPDEPVAPQAEQSTRRGGSRRGNGDTASQGARQPAFKMPFRANPFGASQTEDTMKSPNTNSLTKSGKAPFFGVIVMLALLLTILGVLFIAYTSISKELKAVVAMKETTQAEMSELKDSIVQLQESIQAGADPEKFKALALRVEKLETELAALKTAQATPPKTSPIVKLFDKTQGADAQVVTTAVLDKKLNTFGQAIDRKLELILQKLQAAPVQAQAPVEAESGFEVAEPKAPVVPDVTVRTQPVVRVVEQLPNEIEAQLNTPIALPKVADEAPTVLSSDVKWLMNEPPLNYTLQLASMEDADAIALIASQKGIKNTRVITQTRAGNTHYVLVLGSFQSRADAAKLATQLKAEQGISPWIRKVKDITRSISE